MREPAGGNMEARRRENIVRARQPSHGKGNTNEVESGGRGGGDQVSFGFRGDSLMLEKEKMD